MRGKLTFSNLVLLSVFGALPFLFLPTTTVISTHNHLNSNTIGDDHGNLWSSGSASAAQSQVEVIHHFKNIDLEGDAKNVSSFLVYDGYVDTDNSCEFCIRVEYTPGAQGVAGMSYFDTAGQDLTGAKRVTFIVMDVVGDPTVKFMIAGKKFDQANSDVSSARIFKTVKFAEATQSIHPDKNWTKFEVDVSKIDLKDITHPFAFKITSSKNSEVVLYMKYIIYDTQSAKNPLPTENNPIA